MNIQQVNKVVMEYLVKMLEYHDDINIHNIKQDDYDNYILNQCLNNYKNGLDIITEYFGNVSVFDPSHETFVKMLKYIDLAINTFDEDCYECILKNTLEQILEGNKLVFHYCNALRFYAFWYIYEMGYDKFMIEIKNYIYDDE